MVAEILLHIGMHKTGTTALQMALADYDDGRTRFARLGEQNHSIPLVTCFVSEPHRYHVWQRIGASRERVVLERAAMMQRIDAELAMPHDRLLVVGEELSLLNTAAAGRLAAHLGQDGRHLSGLAYLRDPMGYVTSAFQQQVRGGQASFTLPAPYYRPRFEKYLTLFGQGNMRFRAYRPDLFAGGSVISDYCDTAGIAATGLPDRRDNASLPLEAVRLVHLFNRAGPPARSIPELNARSAMIRHVASAFKTRFTLDPFILGGVIDAAEVDWIEQVSGVGLGARIVPTDREKAEAALQALLGNVGPAKIDWLRAEIAARGQKLERDEGLADLVNKLYLTFLAAEHARRNAARSATG